MNEARALRIAVGIACLVPLVGGGAGVLTGGASLELAPAAHVTADSHIRYLSGLLLAIGIGFLMTIPAIERQGPRIRLLTVLVVIGGLARLGGLALHGAPEWPMLFGLAMELLVTPALCAWQWRVARLAGGGPSPLQTGTGGVLAESISSSGRVRGPS